MQKLYVFFCIPFLLFFASVYAQETDIHDTDVLVFDFVTASDRPNGFFPSWKEGFFDTYTGWTTSDGIYGGLSEGLRLFNGATFTVTSKRKMASAKVYFASGGFENSDSNPLEVNINGFEYSRTVKRGFLGSTSVKEIQITYANKQIFDWDVDAIALEVATDSTLTIHVEGQTKANDDTYYPITFGNTQSETLTVTKEQRTKNGMAIVPIGIEGGLASMACRGLRITIYDNHSTLICTRKVPIIVKRNTTTAEESFTDVDADRCKTCDVVVRDNATLTKAAKDTPKDRPEAHNIYVYAGATLCIPSNAPYKVNGLVLRRNNTDDVATLDISAADDLQVASGEIYLDMRIDAQNWHWFSLPTNCKVADVARANGRVMQCGSDWLIATYDGARRAEKGTLQGSNWEHYTGDVIEAGKGYIVGLSALKDAKGNPLSEDYTYHLRFPMSATDVLSTEVKDKTLPVYAYGAGTAVKPNNQGWNLVGNPYTNYYTVDAANPFDGWRLGRLEYDETLGEYTIEDTTNPYVVIPVDGGGKAYAQKLASEVKLKPFTSYFVQVGKDGDADNQPYEVQFDAVNRGGKANVMQRLIAADTDVEDDVPVIVGVALRNGKGEQDETSLVIAEQFGSAYEMGADFFKWFGDYYRSYTNPVLYTLGADGGKRAFNAVNADEAGQNIPLGLFAARAGEYTFTLDRRYDDSRVDKVWLFDAERGVHTNLLEEDYRFASAKNEGEGRFFLSVALRKPAVTTDSEAAETEGVRLRSEGLHLLLRGLPAEAEVWVYDPTGKLLVHEHTRHYERQYSVPQQGAYMVRVVSDDQTVTLRTICK